MSTKKTVDTEIVEDVEKIEPEDIEEVKEPVADDAKEIVPVVKAPLRGISTPSMIHTHLDNFLAKIVGETPIDDKIRNSIEFWLNEISEKSIQDYTTNTGKLTSVTINGVEYSIPSAGSGGAIYYHGIDLYKGGNTNSVNGAILSTSGTRIETVAQFENWAKSITGRVNFNCNGTIQFVEDNKTLSMAVHLLRKNVDDTFTFFGVIRYPVADVTAGYRSYSVPDLSSIFDACIDSLNQIN